MKPISKLLLLLPILAMVASSCSMGQPSERKPVELVRGDGTKITCFMPPPDVIAKGAQANADLTAIRLGKVLEATGGVGLDIERIRQELPPEVATFEVVEFRICAQYANGVLSKEAYETFNEKIMPAYTKNPPPQTASTVGAPASVTLVERCGPSFTTKRPAAKFLRYWASLVNQLRDDRNIQYHDFENLMQLRGRPQVETGMINPYEELNFTLDCLGRNGYLKLERYEPPRMVGGAGAVENLRIIFLTPSMPTS
jgi:hypothetical protein